MFTTDILIAAWALSLAAAIPIAYFRGAKEQLDVCVENRLYDTYMSDMQYRDEVDISKRRWN